MSVLLCLGCVDPPRVAAFCSVTIPSWSRAQSWSASRRSCSADRRGVVVPVITVAFSLGGTERQRGLCGQRTRRRGHALCQAERDQPRVLAGGVLAQH